MPRRILILCGLLPALAVPAAAQANDAALTRALTPYKSTLTADLTFMAETMTPPAKATAAAYALHFRRVQSDMATVARVTRAQKPSSKAYITAQGEILSALSYLYGSAGDGLASVSAVQSGKAAAAKADIANLRAELAKGLKPLILAGRTLGLFNG